MPEPRILVFGATGGLGRHALESLTAGGMRAQDVTAAGRNAARLGELADRGFGTVTVDLSNADAVAKAITGHDKVVLISGSDRNRLDQHRSVIDAAAAVGVGHVYYTSGVRADDARFAINADHLATEEALSASGLAYTILRNTWYIENYLLALNVPRRTGVYTAAVGDAVVAPASRKDLGDALAAVVSTDGHDGVTYSLSGHADVSYADIADAMSVVLQREVEYRPVSAAELRSTLIGSGLDDATADFLVGLDETIAAGAFARVGDDLTRLIGRRTAGLVEGLTGV